MLPQHANSCLFLATRRAARRCTNKNPIEICWASLRRLKPIFKAKMGNNDPMKQQLESYMNINGALKKMLISSRKLFKWHENYTINKSF